MSAYDKNACIICQADGGKLHKVCFKRTGEKMLEVASKLPDRSFFLRLNSIPNANDAVANDVQYHLTCWVVAQRTVNSLSVTIQELEDIDRVLADIEIVNLVQESLHDTVLDMQSLNATYNTMIETSVDKPLGNYKRYLKQLLQENIPNVTFIRPPSRNQSERVCSSQVNSAAIEKSHKNSWNNYKNIFEAARIVRNDVIKEKKCQFEGDFGNFTIPQSLKSLLHWIIKRPRKKINQKSKKKETIDRSVSIVAEIIMSLIKTNRQINYDSQRSDGGYFF